MSDPVTPPIVVPSVVTQTFWQKLGHQLEVTFRSGSTYVVLAVSVLAGIFREMTPEQQQALLGIFPFLKGWGASATAAIVFLATRIKPSSAMSSQTKELVDTIMRLQLNQVLQKQGAQPVAVPPAPAPVPDPILVVDPAPAPPPPPPPDPPPAPPDPAAVAAMTSALHGATDTAIDAALKILRASRRRVDIPLP